MGARARKNVLKQGRPTNPEYDQLAKAVQKMREGQWLPLRECEDEEEAIRARDTIARSIRRRVEMPKGLKLSFRRTEEHEIIVVCEAA